MHAGTFLTDFGMWDAQVAGFGRHYRLLRYDARGHGDTQATQGAYSIGLLVEDAVALLDALAIERVHFVCLSMGGMIAQLLASKHPERLLSVSLCDTACRLPPESAWDERINLALTKGTAAFMQPMTRRWLTPGFYAQHPEIVAKLGAMIAKTSVSGAVGCVEAKRNGVLRGECVLARPDHRHGYTTASLRTSRKSRRDNRQDAHSNDEAPSQYIYLHKRRFSFKNNHLLLNA